MMGLEIYGKYLEGKTIKSIDYLSWSETKEAMWYKRPLVITFTDGSFVLPMRDDEGNDGGSLYYGDGKGNNDIIPCVEIVGVDY